MENSQKSDVLEHKSLFHSKVLKTIPAIYADFGTLVFNHLINQINFLFFFKNLVLKLMEKNSV